jgi:hypothetical protein
MKTTVIYHRADYDGLFSREAARHWLTQFGIDVDFIGWDFGDPVLSWPDEGTIYVLDLPIDQVFGSKFSPLMKDQPVDPLLNRLVWIDHHKSSIESHPTAIPGYRIDGVAACRLTWQWFLFHGAWDPRDQVPPHALPAKEDYVNRIVTEPLALRLAGEYDIWDHRDPRSTSFQFGLDTEIDCNEFMFSWLLVNDADTYVNQLVAQGKCARECFRRRDADVVRHRSHLVELEGLKFLALNTARCNSQTFASRDVPETGHDALMGYFWNGRTWTVSLYHAHHNTTIDLSLIAKKFGGGGHRGACGFSVGNLPGASNLPFIAT